MSTSVCVCVSLSLSVCLSVCALVFAYGRGSVLLRQGDKIPGEGATLRVSSH